LGAAFAILASLAANAPAFAQECTATPFAPDCLCISLHRDGSVNQAMNGVAGANFTGSGPGGHTVTIDIADTAIVRFEGEPATVHSLGSGATVPCPGSFTKTIIPISPGDTTVTVTVDGSASPFTVGVGEFIPVITFSPIEAAVTPNRTVADVTVSGRVAKAMDCLTSKRARLTTNLDSAAVADATAQATFVGNYKAHVVQGTPQHCVPATIPATISATQSAVGKAGVNRNVNPNLTTVKFSRNASSSSTSSPIIDLVSSTTVFPGQAPSDKVEVQGMGPFITDPAQAAGALTVTWNDFLPTETNNTLTTQWKVTTHLQPAAGLKAGATATVDAILEVKGLEVCVMLFCGS
jgi:hypothetical protein